MTSGPVRRAVDRQLATIRQLNPTLHAMTTVDEVGVRTAADTLDARTGDRGTLHGLVLSVKDNIDVAGLPTTLGSELFQDQIASINADAVTLLLQAGAVVVGKAQMHEFAMGTTSIHPILGTCRNPLDNERTVGGSSGGLAASVAAGGCHASLGTDTGVLPLPVGLGRKDLPGSIQIIGSSGSDHAVLSFGALLESWLQEAAMTYVPRGTEPTALEREP